METNNSNGEAGSLAAISAATKIPEFWREKPRLWFAQYESIMAPQKQSDETNYNMVVAKLNRQDIEQVSDIILNPPDVEKYKTIKERLISANEESEVRQFQTLLAEMELGDQKPSQLLRRMRDLARNKVPDETLRIMWSGHLPSAVRAVLAVSSITELDKLAAMADQIMVASRPAEIIEIRHPPNIQHTIDELVRMVTRLSTEVAALRLQRDRSPGRGYDYQRQRNRSHSRARSQTSTGGLCFYHDKFKDKAYKCRQPCTWSGRPTQQQQQPEN